MKLSKFLASALLVLASLLPVAPALAEQAPDVLVREVTSELLDILRSDQAIKEGDPQRIQELVNDKILPHFNFRRITMLAVGRDWRDASAEQQNQLIEAFRTLLVRTYSNALSQYRDEVIDYKPARYAPADKRVQVRTEVRRGGGQPIGIDYMLERAGDSWKVFDVIVAGVSLVTNYRSSFAQEVQSGGVEGLISSLEAKNRALAEGQQD